MYINFPDTFNDLGSESVTVSMIIYKDEDFERIPLRFVELETGYAPSNWRCRYEDFTEQGKFAYNFLQKFFKNETIVILTESEPKNE